MVHVHLVLLCSSIFTLALVACSRILFWHTLGMKSHFMMWKPLVTELARRGHNLTLVLPQHHKGFERFDNVNFIVINDLDPDATFDPAWILAGYPDQFIFNIVPYWLRILRQVYQHPRIRQLIDHQGNESFDLVILDQFSVDLGLYLGKKRFNCSVMVASTSSSHLPLERYMGHPQNLAVVPYVQLGHGQTMTFFQRLKNTILVHCLYFVFDFIFVPTIDFQLQMHLNLSKSWTIKNNILCNGKSCFQLRALTSAP